MCLWICIKYWCSGTTPLPKGENNQIKSKCWHQWMLFWDLFHQSRCQTSNNEIAPKTGMDSMVGQSIYGPIHVHGSKCMIKPANKSWSIFNTVNLVSVMFFFVVVLNKINGCAAVLIIPQSDFLLIIHSVNHSSVILLAPSRPRSLLES